MTDHAHHSANSTQFKTPTKKDARQAIFSEEGVALVVEHQLHDKNSDDEKETDENYRSVGKKSTLLTTQHPNKDEFNDDHGRHVNHRHHHQHSLPPVSFSSPSALHSKTLHPNPAFHMPPVSSTAHSITHDTHSHHGAEKASSMNTINGLWMLIDGIGLAIITAATILEGYELWYHFFHKYWESNTTSLTLWFLGRTFQIVGLLFLIGHASSFQVFHEIEQFGMLMLTIGPIVNMSACYTFALLSDPDHLFQKQWFATETMELIGILVLDVSLIEMPEIRVLVTELVGFVLLCCAAGVTMEFQPVFHPLPSVPSSYNSIVKPTVASPAAVVGASVTANSNTMNAIVSSALASTSSSSSSAHRLLPFHSSQPNEGDVADIAELLSSSSSVFAAAPALRQIGVSSSISSSSSVSDFGTWWMWWVPHKVTWRLDAIHASECCGLILLMCVAYGQYRMKLHKHQQQQQQQHYTSHGTAAAASTSSV